MEILSFLTFISKDRNRTIKSSKFVNLQNIEGKNTRNFFHQDKILITTLTLTCITRYLNPNVPFFTHERNRYHTILCMYGYEREARIEPVFLPFTIFMNDPIRTKNGPLLFCNLLFLLLSYLTAS